VSERTVATMNGAPLVNHYRCAVPSRQHAGSRARLTPLGLTVGITLSYCAVYLARRLQTGVGPDLPVYIWWARRASQLGFSATYTGSRPGTVAPLLAIGHIVHLPVSTIAAVLGVVLVASTAGALMFVVEEGLRAHRRTSILVGVLVAAYLMNAAAGYVATLSFLTCMTAAIGVAAVGAARPSRSSNVILAVVLACAVLAHPILSGIAFVVLGGGLAALTLRASKTSRRLVPASGAIRTAVALFAAALISAGAFVLLRQHPAPPIDTAADAVFRRTGTEWAVFRERIASYLPRLVPVLIGIVVAVRALSAFVRSRERSEASFVFGAAVAWMAATAAGVVVLLVGVTFPGHRLVGVCLPFPVAAGLGIGEMLRLRGDRYPKLRVDLTVVVVVSLLVMLALVQWWSADPIASAKEVRAARAAASRLAEVPPRIAPVVVAQPPAQYATVWAFARLNILRDAFEVRQIPSLRLFAGGVNEFLERGGRDWPSHSPQVIGGNTGVLAQRSVAFAIEALDRRAFYEAAAAGTVVAAGVAVVGDAVRPAHEEPPADSIETFSPWVPLVLGPLLICGLALLGWPIARSVVRLTGISEWSIAPSLGFAGLSACSMVVGAMGVRLEDAGALAAIVLAIVASAMAWLTGSTRAKSGTARSEAADAR
jgi:hypothetical protein